LQTHKNTIKYSLLLEQLSGKSGLAFFAAENVLKTLVQ